MKIFVDSASLVDIARCEDDPIVSGITTNPSLLKKAGVTDFVQFAKNALMITEKPISFEVFADDFETMAKQAREIASWAENVYIKIPVTNTKRRKTDPVIQSLLSEGIKVNVTAVFTYDQMYNLGPILMSDTPSIVSIFAGRISDTGIDPVPYIQEARSIFSYSEVLWASPRSVFDYYRASDAGADIITMQPELIDKLEMAGRDLTEYSLATVTQFHDDAKDAGYAL